MAAPDITPPTPGRDLVVELATRHAASLLAVARRHSLCADDAQDAYQRALEILLRRADSLDPAGAPAWMRTVVKHEALAVRTARRRIVGPAEFDLDRAEARELPAADERADASERMGRSTEALSRLKPNEVRALVLKARGYSYKEIAEITGWTYTKVNRCITEGRRAFRQRLADIEAGRECERWAPALSALADGEASAQDVAELRPHLRHCAGCRAGLRAFRQAPCAVAGMALPATALDYGTDHAAATVASGAGDDSGGPGLLSRAYEAIVGGAHERAVLCAHKLQAGVEAASAGKLAAVAASATALAGGGAAALPRDAAPPAPARAVAAAMAGAPAPTPLREVAPAEPGRERSLLPQPMPAWSGPRRSPEPEPVDVPPDEFTAGVDVPSRADAAVTARRSTRPDAVSGAAHPSGHPSLATARASASPSAASGRAPVPPTEFGP